MTKEQVRESVEIKMKMEASGILSRIMGSVQDILIHALTNKNRVWFCGNGGSAAAAQHLAAELSGRFYIDRAALDAEAIHCNSSYLTAIANDYSFDEVYARIVRDLGKKGDVLMTLSTSGNSENIVKAAKAARQGGLIVVGLTGAGGGRLKEYCDYILQIPSTSTPRIQEEHLFLGHILCEQVEKNLFATAR